QELADISGTYGQGQFLRAFLPSVTAGLGGLLTRAGITGVDLSGFSNLPPAANEPGAQRLQKAIITSIQTATGLGNVSPGGIGQFLNQEDMDAISEMFKSLFGTSNVQAFSEMAEQLQDSLKPVTDFLAQSMQEATTLFGRGLIAAMEAATESDAKLAFVN